MRFLNRSRFQPLSSVELATHNHLHLKILLPVSVCRHINLPISQLHRCCMNSQHLDCCGDPTQTEHFWTKTRDSTLHAPLHSSLFGWSRNALLLWNAKLHYRVHRSPPQDPIQFQFTSLQPISLDHFNTIIFPFSFRSPKWFLPFRFSGQNFILIFPYTCSILHPLWLAIIIFLWRK
jgi:hypothetical protein